MKTNDTIGLATISSSTEEPTAASMWHVLGGSPITDEFLDWPADVFALTDVILGRSEAYRFALSPPGGLEWPPSHFQLVRGGRGGGPAVERMGRGSEECIPRPSGRGVERLSRASGDAARGPDRGARLANV